MIATVKRGLEEDRIKVPMTKLCRWFEVPRRTVYYRSTKAAPKVQERFETPIKAMIEQEPLFGYRTVASLLGFNKNTVQRVFQLPGWQFKKRPVGGLDPECRLCRLWPWHRMNAGLLTFAGSGPAAMAGRPLLW